MAWTIDDVDSIVYFEKNMNTKFEWMIRFSLNQYS